MKIVGSVDVEVVPWGTPIMIGLPSDYYRSPAEHFQSDPHEVRISEPGGDVPKFVFLFNDLHEVEVFASQLTVAVDSLGRKEREKRP